MLVEIVSLNHPGNRFERMWLTPMRKYSKIRACLAMKLVTPFPLLPFPLASEARSASRLLEPGGGCASTKDSGGAPKEGCEDEALTRVSMVGFFTRLIHSGRPRGRLTQAKVVSIKMSMLRRDPTQRSFGKGKGNAVDSPVEGQDRPRQGELCNLSMSHAEKGEEMISRLNRSSEEVLLELTVIQSGDIRLQSTSTSRRHKCRFALSKVADQYGKRKRKKKKTDVALVSESMHE